MEEVVYVGSSAYILRFPVCSSYSLLGRTTIYMRVSRSCLGYKSKIISYRFLKLLGQQFLFYIRNFVLSRFFFFDVFFEVIRHYLSKANLFCEEEGKKSSFACVLLFIIQYRSVMGSTSLITVDK